MWSTIVFGLLTTIDCTLSWFLSIFQAVHQTQSHICCDAICAWKRALKIPSVPSLAGEPNLLKASLCCSSVRCVKPNTLLCCLSWFTSLNIVWNKLCCMIGKCNCTFLLTFLLAVLSDHWETCIHSPLVLLILVVLIMMTFLPEAQNQCAVMTWEFCHSTFPGSCIVHTEIISYLPLISRDFQLSTCNFMWI